jgi:hypothetical protein
MSQHLPNRLVPLNSFSASDLLKIWEVGTGRTPIDHALIILQVAFPHVPLHDLAQLTVSQRDAYLLHLRKLTFGSQLPGLVDCPVCHEHLELGFDARNLQISSTALPDLETTESEQTEITFTQRGYRITFRLPTSADLTAFIHPVDMVQAHQTLAEACIISIQQDGNTIPIQVLPSDILLAFIKHLDDADPFANPKLSAICPACNHSWSIIFDIVSYFWNEICAWAARLMAEIHILASVYGWHEKDILAMSAWRRQRYLELIGS